MNAKILSTGSYLPECEVRNEELSQFPEHLLGLIEKKTGIKARRIAAAEECTSDLAIRAAQVCLGRIGFDALALDAIILATSSPDRIQPATATRIQQKLGACRAFAFDVNSVCSGSIYALHIAQSFIKCGTCKTVLVVAAELYSRYLNPRDFSTFPYFGDGAGAILLGAGSPGEGIVQTLLRSDGSGADLIQVPGGGTMFPSDRLTNPADAYFKMRGKEVYSFAVTRVPEVITELLCSAEIGNEQVRFIVPHQANMNIIREVSSRLDIELSRFYVNLDKYGNTAAASVLIAFDELLMSGKTRPGDFVVLVGFGGGLSWGATLLKL